MDSNPMNPTEAETFATLQLEADLLVQQTERFRQKIARFARGTDTLARQAAIATAATDASLPLVERIQALLLGNGPLAPADIARITHEPLATVNHMLRRMRNTKCPTRSLDDADDARLIHNMGTETAPMYLWVLGDATPTEDLRVAVERLITSRPCTFSELYCATGARRGRLSGVLVDFQRDGRDITNRGGTDRKYRWFMTPKATR